MELKLHICFSKSRTTWEATEKRLSIAFEGRKEAMAKQGALKIGDQLKSFIDISQQPEKKPKTTKTVHLMLNTFLSYGLIHASR